MKVLGSTHGTDAVKYTSPRSWGPKASASCTLTLRTIPPSESTWRSTPRPLACRHGNSLGATPSIAILWASLLIMGHMGICLLPVVLLAGCYDSRLVGCPGLVFCFSPHNHSMLCGRAALPFVRATMCCHNYTQSLPYLFLGNANPLRGMLTRHVGSMMQTLQLNPCPKTKLGQRSQDMKKATGFRISPVAGFSSQRLDPSPHPQILGSDAGTPFLGL